MVQTSHQRAHHQQADKVNNLHIYYIVAIWFFIVFLTNKDNRLLAAILFIGSLSNILIVDYFGLIESFTYIEKKAFLIKFDGSLALIITMVMVFDKTAWKQALILSFAVLCHCMILLYLITETYYIWLVASWFYAVYDELIIISALLQMWVSRDGMARGLHNLSWRIQGLLFRFVFYSNRICKSLFTQKERKAKT